MRGASTGALLGGVVFLLLYTRTIGSLPLDHYSSPRVLTYAAATIAIGAFAGWLLAWFGNRN